MRSVGGGALKPAGLDNKNANKGKKDIKKGPRMVPGPVTQHLTDLRSPLPNPWHHPKKPVEPLDDYIVDVQEAHCEPLD